MTSELTALEARDWLAGAAAPGRRWLLLAAGCSGAGDSVHRPAMGGACAGSRMMCSTEPARAGRDRACCSAAVCSRRERPGARRDANQPGGNESPALIRRRLVAGLLPRSRRYVEPDPATAALAAVELTDDVADHHAQTLPQRVSAPVSMALIFVVTAVVQWPAAVILLLASMLLPLNLRLAGLFAKEGADSPDGGRRQARRGRPRQFQGYADPAEHRGAGTTPYRSGPCRRRPELHHHRGRPARLAVRCGDGGRHHLLHRRQRDVRRSVSARIRPHRCRYVAVPWSSRPADLPDVLPADASHRGRVPQQGAGAGGSPGDQRRCSPGPRPGRQALHGCRPRADRSRLRWTTSRSASPMLRSRCCTD